MRKLLKRRFIMFTMAAVSCLLLFLVMAINGLNWLMLDRQSDRMLDTLVAADGAFYRMDFTRPPDIFGPLNMDRMQASRFFIVRSDQKGRIKDVNTDQISAIDKETAVSYAREVLDAGRGSGRLKDYKYAVKQVGTDQLIFFMDNSVQYDSFRLLLFVTAVIALVCWLVLFLIVFLLSGRAIRPVVAGMEKQKQFITNAGHEMKTPLAIIQSNNDTMALIHGENKYNVHIRNQTKRLNVLMSELLTLARLDEEQLLPTEEVDISHLLGEMLPVYREGALQQNLQLEARIEEGVVLRSNKTSMQQLLTILLDNAVRYTPEGGRVEFSLFREGKHILLVEENTCDTALEPDPERFFERFYRGDAARTQGNTASGYGIGLSAARAICESFGGKLTAEYPARDRIRFTARF
ncbi:MAG: HAMP domain-containing sensor histidine kinase [Lachnospiraceae bacterium]|nr:HAMP domain-containing sensor histidine kinase [Lachnospiraceae bacterium]